MEALSTALEWVQNVVFLLVGLWAFARWRRSRTEQSMWLAATFLSLTFIIAVGLVFGEDGPAVVGKVLVAVLAVFPYLLLRFLGSFEPVPVGRRRVVEVWTVLVAGAGIVLPDLEDQTVVLVYGLAFVGLWLYALGMVAVRFWRAGAGQPTLVRRRLRTLAVASFAIGLALLLIFVQAAAGDGGDAEVGPMTVLVQLVALASAGSFLLGFAPPSPVKAAWRQPEEHRLHEASVQLMAATTPQEVADLLVPHVRDVVGARGAALVHKDETVASIGVDERERAAARAGTADAISYAMTTGTLFVWTNSYTPFFGEDELELLARLSVLTDLALARTALLASERAARIELEAANAELESFVYSASHDLKSPLIAIQSYLDVLTEETADVLDEETAWYVERMRSNAQYMEALVGDLLELSRVGRVETQPDRIDLNALVTEIGGEVTERYPAATITVDELPSLWMNPLRCRQLFRNLIENAASHGGDAISVWVDARPATDGGVEVLVRDDGDGVPEEYRDRIFGVFERLQADDGSEKGTGIGLAICRKITDTIGGRIWVTDHADGAEFAILFPSHTLADAVNNTVADAVNTETIEELRA